MNLAPDPETAALLHFLRAQRTSVLAIVEGLDSRALNATVLPTGWSPLGMIEHLAHAERHWFQRVATGSVTGLPWPSDPEGDGAMVTRRSADEVFGWYRDQCRISDEVLATTGLSSSPVGEVNPELADEVTDLRRIALHMIEETARHAGHLDIARELLDGKTGLGPR